MELSVCVNAVKKVVVLSHPKRQRRFGRQLQHGCVLAGIGEAPSTFHSCHSRMTSDMVHEIRTQKSKDMSRIAPSVPCLASQNPASTLRVIRHHRKRKPLAQRLDTGYGFSSVRYTQGFND